jgi:hypothetical protein
MTCVMDTWAILGSLWRGNGVTSPGPHDREKGRDKRATKVDGDRAAVSNAAADTGGGLELAGVASASGVFDRSLA